MKSEEVTDEELNKILSKAKGAKGKKSIEKVEVKKIQAKRSPKKSLDLKKDKETKDLEKKAVELAPKPKPAPIEKPVKTPDIEFVLRSTTKYDLNWYYMKEKFVALKKWILTPYTLYANWFNRSFNTPKPKQVIKTNEEVNYEQLKDLFEEIKPELTQKIYSDINKTIAERRKVIIIKGVEK